MDYIPSTVTAYTTYLKFKTYETGLWAAFHLNSSFFVCPLSLIFSTASQTLATNY